jgi:hypothetical protein
MEWWMVGWDGSFGTKCDVFAGTVPFLFSASVPLPLLSLGSFGTKGANSTNVGESAGK